MIEFNLRHLYFITFATLHCAISPLLKTLVIALCFIFSTRSLEKSLMAFSFVSFIFILNPKVFGYIMPIHGFLKIVFSLFLYVVTIVKYRNYIKEVKLFKYISAFCVIILFLNIINTTNPVLSISILKLISFYCTSCFIIVSFTLVNNIKNILSWLFSMGLFLVLSSIFLYVFFQKISFFF